MSSGCIIVVSFIQGVMCYMHVTLLACSMHAHRHTHTHAHAHAHAHTHTHLRFMAFCTLHFVLDYPGKTVPEPIWILLKQETVSGSGIRLAICKSAPCPSQITMAAPCHSVFLQAGCPSCRPTNSIKALKVLSIQ